MRFDYFIHDTHSATCTPGWFDHGDLNYARPATDDTQLVLKRIPRLPAGLSGD
jgi:hypothetical protein